MMLSDTNFQSALSIPNFTNESQLQSTWAATGSLEIRYIRAGTARSPGVSGRRDTKPSGRRVTPLLCAAKIKKATAFFFNLNVSDIWRTVFKGCPYKFV